MNSKKTIRKNKSYYIWLASKQIDDLSISVIRGLTSEKLKNIVKDDSEYWEEYKAYISESIWHGSKLNILEQELISRGVLSKNLNYEDCICKLENSKNLMKEPDLDSDQLMVLKANEKNILLSAGPGAGKTTTLCAFAANRIKSGAKGVVFVVYTKAAQSSIESIIRKYGVSITPRKYLSRGEGLFVLTFHQYAYQRMPGELKSYRKTLTNGIDQGSQSWETWDLVIIDEVQDITSEHEPLLKQIENTAKQTIYAGDARQQIYTGSNFAMKAWNDSKYKKYKLRYNHRSRPEIVDLLNIFSSTHFGKYHIEQIASRKSNTNIKPILGYSISGVKDINTNITNNTNIYQDIGIKAADVCAMGTNTNNTSTYMISPISTRKFRGTNKIITAFRERIIQCKAPWAKILESGVSIYRPREKVTPVGNSYLLKGTEAGTVVVVQADIPYDQIIAPRDTIARLIYVALSRARDTLVIIINGEIDPKGLLKCIATKLNIKVAEQSTYIKRNILKQLNVTEDLLNYDKDLIEKEQIKINGIPQRSLKAADFLGLLVEGHLSNKLGLKPPNKIRIVKSSLTRIASSYIINNELIVNLPLKSRLSDLRAGISKGSNKEGEYLLALIRYSINADQIWTLSSEFESETFIELTPLVDLINNKLGKASLRSHRVQLDLKAHRSPWSDPMGVLVGISDIETDQFIIEVKHAKHKVDHLKQVLVYSHMINKQPVLVNTKTGRFNIYSNDTEKFDTNKEYLSNFSRAVLGAKQAMQSRIYIDHRLQMNMLNGKPDLMISIDIEHTRSGRVLEIGAVAFSRGTGEIISIYYSLANGVIPNQHCTPYISSNEYFSLNEMCGFNSVNVSKDESDKMVSEYKEWMTNFGNSIILQWSGSDAKLLGIKTDTALTNTLNNTDNMVSINIDGRACFMRWLEKNDRGRKGGTKLENAVEEVLFKDYFVPHRAFEDAIACMGIYLAISK